MLRTITLRHIQAAPLRLRGTLADCLCPALTSTCVCLRGRSGAGEGKAREAIMAAFEKEMAIVKKHEAGARGPPGFPLQCRRLRGT